MHGITKTFRRKTELCIYISNHKGKHLVFLNAPSQTQMGFFAGQKEFDSEKLGYFISRSKTKGFFPPLSTAFDLLQKNSRAQKCTFTHQQTKFVSIISEFFSLCHLVTFSTCWCCPFVPRSCLLECTSSVLRTHQDGKYWEILWSFVQLEPLTCLWFVSSVRLHWLGHVWGSVWWF